MKRILIPAIFLGFSISTAAAQTAGTDNTLTPEEEEEGWQLLFDGESTEQWRGYNMDHFPEEVWSIENGALAFTPVAGMGGNDIITRETFRDFDLKLEYRIEEGANSGIFHHVIEQPGVAIYWSGPEYQIIDDVNYGNLNESQYSASLYDLIPASPRNTRPAGEWNSVRIVSDGARMEYWQNGEKVVEFERWTFEWFELIRNSKFRDQPSFGSVPEGHIGLQDHGDAVMFRNIRIRRL